ncbi:MAG: hypothetical protein AAF962_23145 [Actinomycetota bacterium]
MAAHGGWAAVLRPTEVDADGRWSISDTDARALGSGLGAWLDDAKAEGPTSSMSTTSPDADPWSSEGGTWGEEVGA